MIDAELVLRGTVVGQRQSNFEGKISNAIQLLRRNGKQAVEVVNVKLTDGDMAAKYTEGSKVELIVDASAYENTVYYRVVRDAKDKPEAAKAERTPAKP